MRLLYLAIAACLFASCANPNVGPMPDVKPAVTSNTAARANIKVIGTKIGQSRKSIKDVQTSGKQIQDNLGTVDADLNKLLGK